MVKALNSIAKVRSAVIAKSQLLKTGVVSSEGPTLDEIHAAEIKAEAELKARKEAAELIGKTIAKKIISKGIDKVAFDRGRYKYHGLIKILAEAARIEGLNFQR